MTSDKRDNRLSEEDQKRVDEYLSTPVPSVERKPFRPLLLLFWLWVVVMVLGGVAWGLGKLEGYI